MTDQERTSQRGPATRLAFALAGGLVVGVGVVLLVLPGPGLLLVLGGLLLFARGVPAAERYVGPVRTRAMDAAEQSVGSLPRVAASVLAGLALVALGVVWGLVPTLPFGGWPTGSSLILSGLLLLALLVYSYRRVQQRR